MNKLTSTLDNLTCNILGSLTAGIKKHTQKKRLANYDAKLKSRMEEPFYRLWVDRVLTFKNGREALDLCRKYDIFYEDIFTKDINCDKHIIDEVYNKSNKEITVSHCTSLDYSRIVALQKTKLWYMEDLIVQWHGNEGLALIKKCRDTNTFLLGCGEKWEKQCEENGINRLWIDEASDYIDAEANGDMYIMAGFLKEYPRKDILEENQYK